MLDDDMGAKLNQYESALSGFIDRVKEDRWVLAVVQVGSINEETIWRKDGIGLWIVEADGVTRRRQSDGEEHRIWRTMVENDINLWAEIIPRARFKRMVEGASRTAFSFNFFARRTLIYSADESISNWFDEANTLAKRDQQHELLIMTSWVIHELRHARRLLILKKDLDRTWQVLLEAAHALAATQLVMAGEICETHAMYRALELNPDLFNKAYRALLSEGPDEASIHAALQTGEQWLLDHAEDHLQPVVKYLKKQRRTVPLSELANHFAFTQLYPWYLESACEWLVQQEKVEKLGAEMLLTKKSRHHVEEPAYLLQVS